jgi:hypothetical protein
MKRIISAVLLIVCGFASTNVLAHTPLAREAHAVIQSIDYEKQSLILTYPQGSGPQTVTWNSGTTFLCDGKSVPATELKEGLHTTIFYHSPFFGKPFAVKVVWSSSANR